MHRCSCSTTRHERPWCPTAIVTAQRASMYEGLFDDRVDLRRMRSLSRVNARVLAPDYQGSDPASRRFASVEL
jgi:hypothetical protein